MLKSRGGNGKQEMEVNDRSDAYIMGHYLVIKWVSKIYTNVYMYFNIYRMQKLIFNIVYSMMEML